MRWVCDSHVDVLYEHVAVGIYDIPVSEHYISHSFRISWAPFFPSWLLICLEVIRGFSSFSICRHSSTNTEYPELRLAEQLCRYQILDNLFHIQLSNLLQKNLLKRPPQQRPPPIYDHFFWNQMSIFLFIDLSRATTCNLRPLLMCN